VLLVLLLLDAWLLELCCNALRAPMPGSWDCCCACCCSPWQGVLPAAAAATAAAAERAHLMLNYIITKTYLVNYQAAAKVGTSESWVWWLWRQQQQQ
jgi:hypothetical protein